MRTDRPAFGCSRCGERRRVGRPVSANISASAQGSVHALPVDRSRFDAAASARFPAIDSEGLPRHPAPMPTARLSTLSSLPRAAGLYYVTHARAGPD
jgi:hypothetical protein